MNHPVLFNSSYLRSTSRLTLRGLLIALGFGVWMIKPVGDYRLTILGYLLVALGAGFGLLSSGFWIDRRLASYSLASIFVGAVSAYVGVTNSNPGTNSEIVFFIVLPFVWIVIACGIDVQVIRTLVNTIPIVGIAIGSLGFIYWLEATGRGSFPWVFLLDLGQGVGTNEFGYGLRFYPISTLVFLLPFLIMSIVVKDTYSWKISRALVVPATFSSFALLFVSGRRVLFVSLILSLGIGYFLFLYREQDHKARSRMYGALIVTGLTSAGLSVYTGFSLGGLINSLLDERSDSARSRSASALLESWSTAPVLGNGLGATVEGSVRSTERPWNFELQYHLILNATGLFGFMILLFVTFQLFQRTSSIVARQQESFGFMIPLIVGSMALVIANASNPYMHTPGHYWMFFILVLGANAIHRPLRETARSVITMAPMQRSANGQIEKA